MVGLENRVVIEVFGEGKTDVGHNPTPQSPSEGVVPILLHMLCGRPDGMMVKRFGIPFLQQKGTGKGLWQKVRFAKRQARYGKSDAAVFVVDTEGDLKGKREQLAKGRDAELPQFPMAVGVAHPCIEAWLLADAQAIRRGLSLSRTPEVPDDPEALSAPCRDRRNNAKSELAKAAGSTHKDISAREKDGIAAEMNDMDLVRTRCPAGFGPFAGEVESRIRPLF